MVHISRVTTRGGDKGQTSLGNGERVDKNHIRIMAIGDVDELNSFLGLAILSCAQEKIKHVLCTVQNDLFDMGADLCRPDNHEWIKNDAKSGDIFRISN